MSDNFVLDFCPTSYWGPQGLSSYYGSHITGELRRQAAKRAADAWDGPVDYLQPSLDSDARSMRASIHPWCMGGEYLPPLRPDEVEIARVSLRSVTMDVFSIRARRSGDRIYYSCESMGTAASNAGAPCSIRSPTACAIPGIFRLPSMMTMAAPAGS